MQSNIRKVINKTYLSIKYFSFISSSCSTEIWTDFTFIEIFIGEQSLGDGSALWEKVRKINRSNLFLRLIRLFSSLPLPFSKKKKREMKITIRKQTRKSKKFFFLFLIPFHSKSLFHFYFKYDRNVVLLIFRKKKKRWGKREKRAVGESIPLFPKQKEKKFECINVPAGWRYPEN